LLLQTQILLLPVGQSLSALTTEAFLICSAVNLEGAELPAVENCETSRVGDTDAWGEGLLAAGLLSLVCCDDCVQLPRIINPKHTKVARMVNCLFMGQPPE
jgi:hypothetical protein